ncbi:MAG: nucleotidyltransferase domain-containing protein [Candidatus Aminicenantes bacterium]|nr:nucleotidyltransferase domain-containing protein [Candidatus Aminicenantes bacterium]
MRQNSEQRRVKRDYEDKYMSIVKKTVLEVLKDRSCQVFLFGSRARGTFRLGSDMDVGVSGLDEDFFSRMKSRILLKVEESIVPFDVDIINFDIVDGEFKKEARKNRIQWK